MNQELLEQIAENLVSLAEQVKEASVEASHTVQLPLQDVRAGYPEAPLAALKSWVAAGGNDAQYIYQVSASEGMVIDDLHKAFSLAKDNKTGGRAYARLHHASQCLYVGSSSSPMARLKQHLGFGAKGTYAMQICHWLPPQSSGSLKIDVWRFSKETPKAVIQVIEDGLWASRQPMFGRQGAR
ncbi:GIY-YIG nuclease family protein [Pseudomonas sp. NY15181]|uniref:GIY-YIG nuclease family protein n=1 Tax=Pseudomonas sp. NY15181 TaxID=3400349 RepID=UPI003A8C23FA